MAATLDLARLARSTATAGGAYTPWPAAETLQSRERKNVNVSPGTLLVTYECVRGYQTARTPRYRLSGVHYFDHTEVRMADNAACVGWGIFTSGGVGSRADGTS